MQINHIGNVCVTHNGIPKTILRLSAINNLQKCIITKPNKEQIKTLFLSVFIFKYKAKFTMYYYHYYIRHCCDTHTHILYIYVYIYILIYIQCKR